MFGALIQFLRLAVIAYAVVCGGMYFFQDWLVFHPNREISRTPEDAGLAYQEVVVHTDSPGSGAGVPVHGWYLPAPTGLSTGPASTRAVPVTVLFLHGNAGNISHRLRTLELLHRLGFATYIIDYPGYGSSGGEVGEQSAYAGAQAAMRHLTHTRGVDPSTIVVFGRSLGGAIAIWLAERTPGLAALVVEASFTSLGDVGADHYPWLPTRWLADGRFESEARIARVTAPVLVTHGRADRVVPYPHGVALYRAAPAPRRFLELAGGHNNGFLATGPTYEEALLVFVEAARGRLTWAQADAAGLFSPAP